MVVNKTKKTLPNWANPLLQGIAYWIGYKQNLYRHYPLTEGAIVGEAASLIHANLSSHQKLECEILYKNIINGIKGDIRSDLVIKENDITSAIIEVKRGSAPIKLIKEDLNRLGNAKKLLKNIRCFLLLVSQGKRPAKFVNNSGEALHKIEISNYNCSVRRVCKASSSFRTNKNAHYAVLIEVSAEKRKF